MLQIFLFVGVVSYIIGLFYRQILIGLAVCFCLYIFLKSNNVESKPTPPEITQKVEVEVDNTPTEYLQDCIRLTGKTQSECKDLWNDRE